jgi:iron complex outermembrane receptor protein
MSQRLSKFWTMALILVLSSAGNVASHAAEGETTGKLEEVTVTARKRAENLQDVPTSISALTTEDIQNMGLQNVQDIAFVIPNFSWSHLTTLSNTICIRGICSDSNSPGFDTSIAVTLDDVYIGRAAGFATSLLDIDRIEVLRGPQGTLQGRNATGGAINIVSARPSNDPQGLASLYYGNYNQVIAQALVSGPIVSDTVSGKIAVERRSHDGFGENTDLHKPLDTEDSWALRAQLRVTPTKALEVLFTSDYEHFNTHDFHNSYGPPDVTSAPPQFFSRLVGGNIQNYGDREVYGFATNVYWTLPDNLTLASISSYRGYDVIDVQDATGFRDFGPSGAGTFLGMARQDQQQRQFSQELRLSSPAGDRLSWLGGLYYYWEKLHDYENFLFGLNTGTVVNGNASISDSNTFTNSSAAFGSVTFNATDFWTLTAGTRYTHNARHTAVDEVLGVDGTMVGPGGMPFQYVNMPTDQNPVPETFLAPVEYGISRNALADKVWTADFSVTEHWTRDISTYLKYASGFKGGGFNANFDFGFAAGTVKPEHVDSYEVGLRSDLLNRRLRVNATAYYLKQRDQQVIVFDNTLFVYVTSNAPRTKSYGSELEVQAVVTDELTASLAVGTEHARFEAGQWSGNSVPGTAPVDVAVTGNYVKSMTHSLEFFAYTDVNWHDGYYTTPDNESISRQKPYWWVDARVGIRSSNGRWSVAFYDRNALNTNVLAYATNVPGLYTLAFLEEPRTYGVEGRIKF